MGESSNQFKYGTLFVMLCAWLGTIFDWSWLWGILFLFWVIGIVRTGNATVVEPVNRKENPMCFCNQARLGHAYRAKHTKHQPQ